MERKTLLKPIVLTKTNITKKRGTWKDNYDDVDDDNDIDTKIEAVTFNKYSRKHKGRKSVVELGKVKLSHMELALRQNNGLITKAASTLRMPISTLQNYIKKYSTLREVMFETRASLVDTAENSLADLVKDKNLTAVIFTLKCLAQDRGYIDVPKKDRDSQAPIIINLIGADKTVRLPRLPAIAAKAQSIADSVKPRKSKEAKLIDDIDADDEAIDAEYSEVKEG